ncbi:MAG: exo-alpha-sialidase [bacterium]|nr:exo-alpha-sialidase [bacterium]
MILGWDGMRRSLVLAALAAVLTVAAPAMAQTPVVSCGADSLYLFSPETMGMKLATSGRAGLTLTWPDLDPNLATCFALTDEEGLGFTVEATGGFGDRVDRQLLFTATGAGTIGGAEARNLIVSWSSEGSSAYGRLAGVLNLSNNGGFWNLDDSAGSWSQTNDNLPMSWRAVNCVAMGRGSDGVLIAGMTRGSALQADPAGLYRLQAGAWTRLAADVFDGANLITQVAVSPANSSHFAVGTNTRGLYVTQDGGQTFTNWTNQLAPLSTPPNNFRVSAMEWTTSRLVVAITSFGVFVSDDDGVGFDASTFLVPVAPGGVNVDPPIVNGLASDPANPNRLVAALQNHGTWESVDGGLSWSDLYGNLNVVDPETPGSWVHNGGAVAIVAGAPATIVVGLIQEGIYRTTDGGVTWSPATIDWATLPLDQQPTPVQLLKYTFANVPGRPGTLALYADTHGLLMSNDSGATWTYSGNQPALDQCVAMLPGPGTGDLILGSWGGGLYQVGSPLELRDTYTTDTTSNLRSLNLGLFMTFGAGAAAQGDIFRVKAQTFQGWAVWRSSQADPDNMTLVGLYDRVNPEDCIVGYCGDESYEVVPRCYAAKRAACFDFSTPDSVRFFDDEIYNGFGYNYAVSSFDYGNTALASPENNSASLIFSPRWLGDAGSPFPGAGNRSFIEVNEAAAAPTEDEEIYAFPNPVRRGAGFPGDEGERVAFTNLPPGSRVRVFTAAGDDVNDLGPDQQSGAQIYWDTDNHEGESVAPGVYLYKVEMPERSPYWGRVVVIR